MKTSITFMDYSMIYAYIRISSAEQNSARFKIQVIKSKPFLLILPAAKIRIDPIYNNY